MEGGCLNRNEPPQIKAMADISKKVIVLYVCIYNQDMKTAPAHTVYLLSPGVGHTNL